MTIARYVVSVVLIVVGLVWIGQGLGMIAGSSMSGQSVFAILGAALLVAGGGQRRLLVPHEHGDGVIEMLDLGDLLDLLVEAHRRK